MRCIGRADAVAHLADLQRRQQRRVAGEHADLAVAGGQHDLIDFDVDDLPFARDDGEIDLRREGRPSVSLRRLVLHLLGALQHVLDGALHVEGLLRDVVVLAFDDLAEAADRVGDLDVLALDAGELLGHVERLREEALDLAGAGDGELVFFRQLVDTENGDDVLQVLVRLQDAPCTAARGVVVLVADDARIENARGGGQRIDRGIDAELRDLRARGSWSRRGARTRWPARDRCRSSAGT